MNQVSDLNQTKIKVISLASELIEDLQDETDVETVDILNRLIDMVSQFTHKPPPGRRGYDDVFDEFEEAKRRIKDKKKRGNVGEGVAKKINELLKEIKHTEDIVRQD